MCSDYSGLCMKFLELLNSIYYKTLCYNSKRIILYYSINFLTILLLLIRNKCTRYIMFVCYEISEYKYQQLKCIPVQ